MSEPIEVTGEPVEGTVVDDGTVVAGFAEEEPTTVEARPGEEGGGAHVETVTVYNEAQDATAEIQVKSLPLWQEQGWVEDTEFEEEDEGADTSE